jgi:hypothetical protein
MPRRKKSLDAAGLGALIALGLIAIAVRAIVHATQSPEGWMFILLIVGGIVLVFVLKATARRKKLEYLMSKYGNEQIIALIYSHRYWQGQTAGQLLDSLGNPHGVDRKLLKTMKREVWKYNPRGVNRYGLRITLDNDVVSSWDHKQR